MSMNKKGQNYLLWIILAVLIVLIIWFVIKRLGG
jgi:preprotein translocase subunit YajC